MTPGPTRVPERVLRAGARPMIHHRTREFSAELATLIELIKPVFGTTSAVLPVHTTGRGALEAALCNFFSAGDEIIVCCNGKFGEMWAGFAESYTITAHRISTDWTRAVDVMDVARSRRTQKPAALRSPTPTPRPAWSTTSRPSRARFEWSGLTCSSWWMACRP